MSDGSDGSEAFERIAARLDYPMFVVTTAGGGRRAGCLVGFLTQCSIDPVRVAVCISKQNHTYGVAGDASTLCVHALTAKDRRLAELFGGVTGHAADKFAQTRWHPGPAGVPVLDGCSWFAARILDRFDAGDHVAFLVEPYGGEFVASGDDVQLGFQHARDIEPGHEA